MFQRSKVSQVCSAVADFELAYRPQGYSVLFRSFELSWFGCSSTQAPEIWFPCFIIEHTACCSDYSDIPFHSILKVW